MQLELMWYWLMYGLETNAEAVVEDRVYYDLSFCCWR
jgi:hypothetical protein